MPLPLEADGRAPALLGGDPLHPRDAAGVVGTDSLGPEHFHAGAVDIVEDKAALRDLSGSLAAAASRVTAAQAPGADIHHTAAVTPAAPGSTIPDILRGAQDGQTAEPCSAPVVSK